MSEWSSAVDTSKHLPGIASRGGTGEKRERSEKKWGMELDWLNGSDLRDCPVDRCSVFLGHRL